jgi:addiction module HigA family antidote
MIRSFKGKFAESILQGRIVPKGFPANLAKVARRKLIMVDAAAFLEALNSPPGNRLESLKGDLAGKHSIRINDQWRIVFRWTDAGPEDVEIIDYQTGRMWLPNRSSHMANKLPPIHPGEILREEFLVPLKLTPYAVAAALNVPRTRIERIAREEKPVTADTALRLGKFFKTGAAFWMNIQTRFDLETAEDALAPQIKKITSYEPA